MILRDDLIERLKSKKTSLLDFNYDKLMGPPLYSLLTPMDTQDLYHIATSLKYSGKPRKKYQDIDKIMTNRGFRKFIGGTNRVAYRHPNDESYLIKIATCDVGITDAPRELQNSLIFKPFVTKIFDISPEGAVGVFERVLPIRNREEFLSVAREIYEVIDNWFITGEYIFEDIGTNFFMNWGIRKGFGPVLLDYPFAFKLDGNKLFCQAPDPSNLSGTCEGIIDYDPGWNFLQCQKCGAYYRANELEEKIKNKEIILRSKEEVKMSIRISGGSKGVNKVINTGGESFVKKIPNKPVTAYQEKTPTINVRVTKGSSKPVQAQTVDDGSPVIKPKNVVADRKNNKATLKEASVRPLSILTSVASGRGKSTFVNGVSDYKVDEAPTEDYTRTITPKEVEADEVKELTAENDKLKKDIEDLANQLMEFGKQFNILATEKGNIEVQLHEQMDRNEELRINLEKSTQLLQEVDDHEEEESDTDTLEDAKAKILDMCHKVFSKFETGISLDTEDELDCLMTAFDYKTGIVSLIKYLFNSDLCMFAYEIQNGTLIILDDSKEEIACREIDEVFKPESEEPAYTGLSVYSARVINQKDIMQDLESSKVIVIDDENGDMLNIDGDIVAIDMIDDRSMDNLAFVSQEWYKSALEAMSDTNEDAENNDTGAEDEEEQPPVTGEELSSAVAEFIKNEHQ